MLRGGHQVSAQDKQQQQKHKKRLSFRDPEIENPQKHSLYTGCRSKTLARPTKVTTTTRKASSSVEDLTLEDQALLIAQNVGNAFSDLSTLDNGQPDFLDTVSSVIQQKETEITDCSPKELTEYEYPEDYQLHNFNISAGGQQYLDAFVPPLLNSTMRGPTVEEDNTTSPKNNCIPAESPIFDGRPSTSTQHQIQLLRYQLDQQNQQTQMALHQVQLLQDQVTAESVARRKAQEQNNQLMQQNKELLNHVEKLFQQIEELEKQIQLLEQEKRSKRTILNQDHQVAAPKQPPTLLGNRRPNTDQTIYEKPAIQNRSLYMPSRKVSLTTTKPTMMNTKSISNQNTTTVNRKTSIVPPKPYTAHTIQTKNTDHSNKAKETLQIGDTSPPVQSGTQNPFNSVWKLKSQEDSIQPTSEKSGSIIRSRTSSLSSFAKKPHEGNSAKSTLFNSSSNLSSTTISNKKHSSSTSDLYNSQNTFQGKSLMIDESMSGAKSKSSVSSLNINTAASKLPRYQPYTGWRRASLTNDNEQVSAVSKDCYKNVPQSALFNR